MLSNFARRARNALSRESEKNLLLTGRLLSLTIRGITCVNSLADVEFRVSSQGGEDGIIDWLVERLEIPTHAFIEFGTDKYLESNTRFLLLNRNWRGFIIDGSAENMEFVKNDVIFWAHDLAAKSAFVNCENINEIIADSGFSGEIGLLSIDIDGNDYWVWE